MFGAAVGGGIASVAWIGPVVSPMFPTKTPFGAIGKNLEERILEVGVGAPVAYAINRFVFKNEFNYADIYKKLGIVVVADLVGETLCEMLLLV